MTVGEFADAVKKMRELQKEYARTRNRYMRKEMEEAGEEMELMTVGIKDLWDAVRYNYVLDQKQQIIRRINKHALKCVQECVQVAACCIKALRLREV